MNLEPAAIALEKDFVNATVIQATFALLAPLVRANSMSPLVAQLHKNPKPLSGF